MAPENKNGSQKPLFGDKSLPGQTFNLAPDVTKELNELHSKGIDVNELLREMLKQRREDARQASASEKRPEYPSTQAGWGLVSASWSGFSERLHLFLFRQSPGPS